MNNRLSSRTLTEIALLAALIAITGAIKLPSLLPGLEFQLSAPLAVAICTAFGFKKYIIAGILASTAGLILGMQNLFGVAIQMQFRIVVGIVLVVFGNRWTAIALAGPLGTFVARITLYFLIGKGAWALVAAAFPGMVFTFLLAPILSKTLMKIQSARRQMAA